MTDQIEPKVCPGCGHSLEQNNHGPDQNDLEMDENGKVHWTTCTYCRFCNPEIFHLTHD